MDLAAYFARIGYTGARTVTRETLAAIVYRHTLSIPFENIDAFLGRRISLDPADVARKLIAERRGGWCFEQNLLLGEALRAMGFRAVDLAARVLLGRPVDAAVPRTHRILKVDLGDRSWLADVGFGAQLTPTDVLDFGLEDAQQTPHGAYRLLTVGNERRLEAAVPGEWLPLFRFDLQPQLPADFEPANFQLVHDPASHFTQRLGVSIMTAEGRHGLRGRELSFIERDGNATQRELDTTEVIDALRDVFGLELGGDTAAAIAAKLDAPPQSGQAGLSR